MAALQSVVRAVRQHRSARSSELAILRDTAEVPVRLR
jgi:hypothetical protein